MTLIPLMLIVLFTSVYLLPNLDTINKLKKEKASLQEENR